MVSSGRREEKSEQRVVAASSIHGQDGVARWVIHVQQPCVAEERVMSRVVVTGERSTAPASDALEGRREAEPLSTFSWPVRLRRITSEP